jgi:SH3 domain protein
MRESLFYFMIFMMILCLFPSLIWARTGYVSDRLILNFRQGPDNASNVIKTLKSDTPVIILEEKNEFYKIELQSKETGWVDKNYIIFEMPKTLIIDQLKKENNSLKNKISKLNLLETNLKTIDDGSLSGKDIKYNDLIKKAGNIKKIIQENKVYQKKNLDLLKKLERIETKNEDLLKKLERIETKNEDLLKTGMIKWFMAGFGVLLLGWIVGISVSSRKRKSNSLLH